MVRPIATLTGTMLAPGVSRNGRLYTKPAIARAVSKLQQRIASGQPLPMRTFHASPDSDVTNIAGRVTDVSVDESGAAKYRAEILDTAAGRDVAALIGSDSPVLRNVSIFGSWDGPVRRVNVAGESVETGDDIDIMCVDFTAAPGVPAALIDAVAAAESVARGRLITESVDDVQVAALAPVPAGSELPPRPLHEMSEEDRYAFMAGHMASVFAAVDARKDRSPYWQGWSLAGGDAA